MSAQSSSERAAPVLEHLACFQALVAQAERYAHQGRLQAAAVYGQVASKYAASQHPGLFASPRLERTLLAIGRRLAPPGPPAPPPQAEPGRVLHVLTQVARIGGHTRMLWRWIEQDRGRVHSVALTRQMAVAVPSALREAVAATGGVIHVLDERRGDLLAWALALRGLAASAELVVLHSNPDDVIPLIALADKPSLPPVLFVNHADHLFWLGAGVSDVVANLRESGAALARERRGIAAERCAMLPIPLPTLARTLTPTEAKRRLGLPPDAVVMLTIARPHKYMPFNGQSFVEGLLPVLERHPQAWLIAVGPEHAGPWQSAEQQTAGRVRALGVCDDTELYYQAADIYVDSYPVVSITSLLEAGSYGVPLISRSPLPAPLSVMGADTPALLRCLPPLSASDEYLAQLMLLAGDVAVRNQLGALAQREIAAVHTGPGWQRALRETYGRAAAVSRLAAPAGGPDLPRVEEVDRLLPQLMSGEPELEQILQFQVRSLPADLRARQWLRIARQSRRLLPGLLLPEWLGTRVERLRYPTGSDVYHRAGAKL